MSTPKWEAKSNHFKYPNKFETRDGRKFAWFNKTIHGYNSNTQFYIAKPIGNHKHSEYSYWVYPIPFELVYFNNYLHTWFSHGRKVVIQIK